MANKKITELDAATSLASTDVMPVVDVSADETKKITATDLFRTLPDGTAAAPALAFSSDQANGVYLAGTDTVGISTGGTQRVTVDGSGNVTISGDLTVSGATTTVESTTVTIDDKNIELGSVASPSNTTADGGGITLKGATDKTLKWINSTDSWTFNQSLHVNYASNDPAVLTIENNEGSFNLKANAGIALYESSEHRFTNAAGTEVGAKIIQDGAVELYHNNLKKLETKSDGIDVVGEVQCDFLDVDGGVDIDGGQLFYDATNNLLRWADNAKATFGASDDLQIYHNVSTSFIDNTTAVSLAIRQLSDNADIVLQSDNGTGGVTTYIRCDGSEGEVRLYHYGSEKLNTKSSGVDITGQLDIGTTTIESTGEISMGDARKLKLGNGDDLQIYHDGTNSRIHDAGTGVIAISGSEVHVQSSTQGETCAKFKTDAEVELRYDNAIKFATKSDGIDVTGEVQCDSLDVDGAADITGSVTLHGNLDLQDDDKILLGASDDIHIFANSSGSFIDNTTLQGLSLRQLADDADIVLQSDNGSGGVTTYLRCDGSEGALVAYHYGSQKLTTKSDGIDVTGEVQCDSLDVDGNADISGNLGIATTSATFPLQVETSATGTTSGSNGVILVQSKASGRDAHIRFGDSVNATARVGYLSNSLYAWVNGAERFRVDSSGRLLLGTSSSVDVASTAAAEFQVKTAGNITAAFHSIANAAGPAGILALGHGRGTAGGVLQNDDVMGEIRFAGGDGTDLETQGAAIVAQVDGTPGSNNMPGRLVFRTNSGTSSTTERLRITSTGAWAIEGSSNYGTSGQVLTSNGNDSPTWQDASGGGAGGANAIDMNDNVKINFGASDDLQIYHNTDSRIDNVGPGTLAIRQLTDDADIVLQSDNSSGGLTTYLRCDGSTGEVKLFTYGAEKLRTKTDGVNIEGELQCDSLDVDGAGDITGTLTLHGNLDMQDNDQIVLGSSDDLKLYHDGSNSVLTTTSGSTGDLQIIAQGTGHDLYLQAVDDIFIRPQNGANGIKVLGNGAVEAYHNNSKKIETNSTGVRVTGRVELNGSNGRIEYNNTAHTFEFFTNNTKVAEFLSSGHFVPGTNNTYDLGSSSYRWRNVYTNDLNLSNEGSTNDVDGTWGNYTIQEGEDDLFLINRRNGKKYKFNLTEVS